MADIPVEKKTGIPGWIWALIALLVILGLIWWFMASDDDVDVYGQQGAVEAERATLVVASEPIEEFSQLAESLNKESSLGRAVNLDSVPVQSLAGDMAFWVGGNANERVFVTFNQEASPNSLKEGQVDVNRGSKVNLRGTIKSVKDNAPQGVVVQFPTQVNHYIYATEVQVAD